jgi:hypothetical protein
MLPEWVWQRYASKLTISSALFCHQLTQQTCSVANSDLPGILTVLLALFRKLTSEEIGTYIALTFPHCATIISAMFDQFCAIDRCWV